MKISVLTLFPEFFDSFTSFSIIKRAIGKGIVSFEALNIRDFTKDKYGRTDTPPIGGGAGLVQKAQPIVDAIKAIKTPTSKVVMFSARGTTFNEKKAIEYSKVDHLILLCGHYEGIDERVNPYVDELLSVGDYILTGGEIPAEAVSDAVIRLLDGAISQDSLNDESFTGDTLEYPQYTEPYDFEGSKVPDILYSGNHEAINKWRRKASLQLTRNLRPDMFSQLQLSKSDRRLIAELDSEETPEWEKKALEKGHKFIKK